MAAKLLIVESPGKIKKLSQILGSDWLVKASMGHVRELANDGEDSLGFDLVGNAVNCRFVARLPKGAQTISQLKAAVKQVKTVVLATDADREGETIAWHLQQALHLKNPQRVTYAEITQAAVNNAISHPRQIDMALVSAGLCRSVLDKLVGYKGSPLLWQLQNGAKSMGRVQSATLHLLCQRERQIQSFVPQDYWSIFVDYSEGFRAYYQGEKLPNQELSATPELDDSKDTKEQSSQESSRVLSLAQAEAIVDIARQQEHRVVAVEGKIAVRTPPPAFVTSSLQQAAGTKLKFSPEKTMQVAQSLYESGSITYMRTDSTALSPEFCAQVQHWLEKYDPRNVPVKATQHKQAKGAQEAHEAIRPTDVNKSSVELKTQLSEDEFALYVLIWKRAVAALCQSARLRQTKILTKSGSISWQAKGQVVEEPGYTKYWNNISSDTNLPTLHQGQILTCGRAHHEQKQTQPPPRYSEPKLVQVMEKKGIGRPSTYAATIQTLKTRQYATLTKGNLQPTAMGLEVDSFLVEALPELVQAEFTADMEAKLDAIALGERDWQQYLTDWNRDYFSNAISKARQVIPRYLTNERKERDYSDVPCPQCQNFLAKIPSLKVKKKYFLKCTSTCNDLVMFWSDREKKWHRPQPKEASDNTTAKTNSPLRPAPCILTEYKCPVCQQLLEEYAYQKEGTSKKLLRCSDANARNNKKHKEAVYFHTAKGWWSPKFGNLS